jgi:hypothetical protein
VDGPGSRYNGDRYRDAKSTTGEDKLPEMFRLVEIYRLRAEWQEQERQRKAAEKRRRWDAAMEQPKLRYAKQVRWKHSTKRSRDWQAIRRHREFLTAARADTRAVDASRHAELTTQLDLAERSLGEIDAILHLELLTPFVEEPKPGDPKRFLDGQSFCPVDWVGEYPT